MSRPLPDAALMREPKAVLEQIRDRHWVDVINKNLEADHIHYKHFVSICSGERSGKHFIGVTTHMFEYLLPVQFDTEEAAFTFLGEVDATYRGGKRK